jgi:hypothetical protein
MGGEICFFLRAFSVKLKSEKEREKGDLSYSPDARALEKKNDSSRRGNNAPCCVVLHEQMYTKIHGHLGKRQWRRQRQR